MSKYQFGESDVYLPGTDIPVNRLEIDDAELLHEIESNLLEQAYRTFIDELSPESRFDEACFKSLHGRTFSSLYDWAGQYRTVDMAKGGSLFCRAAYLPKESARIFEQLEREDFLLGARNWLPEQFADRLAYFQGELIALHPFLELNGRITRLFFDLIAIANGPSTIAPRWTTRWGDRTTTSAPPSPAFSRRTIDPCSGSFSTG